MISGMNNRMARSENELFFLFFQEKPAKLLLELFNNTSEPMYGSTIAKRTDCTYSHVIKILKYFEKYNLIKGQKKGRLRLLELTDKGRILAEKLRDISNLF